ncbi:hypothetical protein M501DRAFT_508716 [Patellaria atrata CBS 101060]|uniref:F-box domain-containing protein n=1 Tax=Patellaria atrata CBS 101060 TaxID=1346257 RepID=A0A9P4S3F0_9PEZI|nr:hypothetical protein M501DRAFT_508716 [Patellaria atrata CBS 101060]
MTLPNLQRVFLNTFDPQMYDQVVRTCHERMLPKLKSIIPMVEGSFLKVTVPSVSWSLLPKIGRLWVEQHNLIRDDCTLAHHLTHISPIRCGVHDPNSLLRNAHCAKVLDLHKVRFYLPPGDPSNDLDSLLTVVSPTLETLCLFEVGINDSWPAPASLIQCKELKSLSIDARLLCDLEKFVWDIPDMVDWTTALPPSLESLYISHPYYIDYRLPELIASFSSAKVPRGLPNLSNVRFGVETSPHVWT